MFNIESNLSPGEDEPNHQEVDISQIPIWDINAIEKLPDLQKARKLQEWLDATEELVIDEKGEDGKKRRVLYHRSQEGSAIKRTIEDILNSHAGEMDFQKLSNDIEERNRKREEAKRNREPDDIDRMVKGYRPNVESNKVLDSSGNDTGFDDTTPTRQDITPQKYKKKYPGAFDKK